VLGARIDISPWSVESRILLDEANGPETVELFDFFLDRPNNGIRVIFFFDPPSLSLRGTSSLAELDVDASLSCRDVFPEPRKKSVMSDVFVRRRRAGERPDIMSGQRKKVSGPQGRERRSERYASVSEDDREGLRLWQISWEGFIIPRAVFQAALRSRDRAGARVLLVQWSPGRREDESLRNGRSKVGGI